MKAALEKGPDRQRGGRLLYRKGGSAPAGPVPGNTATCSEQLHIAMRIMGGFAHEVRNPLAVIRGFAQLLLEGKADHRVPHYLTLIVNEVDRINEQIKGFISLSAGEETAHRALDVETLIRDVELVLKNYVWAHGIGLQVKVEPDTGLVRGNAEQLRQAILNLVYNALEATPPGGQVVLRAARADGHLRITVRDDGAGIAEQVRPRVFEPFFSTRDRMGLGLAVSADIIRRHGGKIDLTSTPGRGTTATIILPAGDQTGPGM